jgi:hypothetical protein
MRARAFRSRQKAKTRHCQLNPGWCLEAR